MQILIIKTSSMGDILHTLPALTDAINLFPNVSFDWVIEKNFAQIPTWHPAVKRVITVVIRHWIKNWFKSSIRQEHFQFKRQLQLVQYDTIIDAHGLIKIAALVTHIARGEKHGLDFKSVREPISNFFYDKHHKINKQQHAIERIRQLFAASLNYKLPKSIGDYSISNFFQPILYNQSYLVFLHSTTQLSKLWPENYWQALIKLVIQLGYQVKLPWGAKHEYQRAKRLSQGFYQVEVLPQLSLSKIAQYLLSAKAVISVDTGLSHLAAALNRPNITLYGPTNPNLIGTYGYHQRIICACDKQMSSISVDNVWQILQSILPLV